MSRSWVYAHKRELGAMRLGDGPRARLRFEPKVVAEAIGAFDRSQNPADPPTTERRARRGVRLIEFEKLQYRQRISDVYATTRHKHNSLEKLWLYLDAEYPELASSAQVRRSHMLAFVPYAIARARGVQRHQPHLVDGEDRPTAHQWLTNVRCFFADICSWGGEDGSPFAGWAPPAVPLERHDLVDVGLRRPAAARPSARQPQSSTSSARSPSYAR